VNRDTVHPRARDSCVETVRGAVCRRKPPELIADKSSGRVRSVIVKAAPRQLHMLAVPKALASGEDLMQDRLLAHSRIKVTAGTQTVQTSS